jgi:hypothetical protein
MRKGNPWVSTGLVWSMFVYHNRDGPDLMYRGKMLGRIRWKNRTVKFDPPLTKGTLPTLSNAVFDKWMTKLDEWVSRA